MNGLDILANIATEELKKIKTINKIDYDIIIQLLKLTKPFYTLIEYKISKDSVTDVIYKL